LVAGEEGAFIGKAVGRIVFGVIGFKRGWRKDW